MRSSPTAWRTLVVVAFGLFGAPSTWAGQDDLVITVDRPGPRLNFDWPAVEIGVATYEAGPTGVTVIRFPKRAEAAVDVRGAGPGTMMTDQMRLGYGFPWVDALVLSAGSAYGLEAVAGVAGALKEDGARSGILGDIAGVAGAVVYDFLGHRLNEIYPDKRLAQAALHAAKPGVFPLGAQGAGRDVMQGWFFGCGSHSGQGAAFRQVGNTKIAAFVVVNASGAVTDRDGNLVKCHHGKNWGSLVKTAELLAHVPESRDRDWGPPADGKPSQRNTTIGVVVTNREMGWAGLERLATQVHTSLARAIQPFSTFDDGDALFAVSTGEVQSDKANQVPELIDIDTVASETMWDAILASVPQEDEFVPPPKAMKIAPALFARYVGHYRFGPNAVMTVTSDGGELWASLNKYGYFDLRKDKKTKLMALSDTDFYIAGRYATRLSFVPDSSGRMTSALVDPGPWQQTGVRNDD
jgi:L-aminopeptidase/D-esterase-like protein